MGEPEITLERQKGAGPWERLLVGQSTVAPIGDTVAFMAVAKCLTQAAGRVIVLARLILISISSCPDTTVEENTILSGCRKAMETEQSRD